jgi:hypothetical protein
MGSNSDAYKGPAQRPLTCFISIEYRTISDQEEKRINPYRSSTGLRSRFLGFNPHGHVLITDGCFPEKDLFKVSPPVKLKYLENIFKSKVLNLLISKGKITPHHINWLKSWRHSGFQIYYGPKIRPLKKEAMENMTRSIIRVFFPRNE